ncbi:MAG TPA: hypothetical protein VJN39_09125 [Gemmatimonadales bacterium]|nr:hypothetical protein [Gemmatimonadales bacterium]
MNVSPLVAFAGLVTIGLLAMRLPRLPPRYLASLDATLASGGALVLAGLVLGPGIDFLNRSLLAALAPVTTLTVGWIGAAFGARLQLRQLRHVPRNAWLVGTLGAAAAFTAVALGAWLLTRVLPALAAAWTPRVPAVLTLAAAGAVASPGAVARVARTSGVPPHLIRPLSLAATLETAIGALLITLPLALHRSPTLVPRAALPWLWWLALAGAGGALAAAVFLALARRLPTRVGSGFAWVATLAFAAGLAYAAGLSPFAVCAVAAAVIVNRSSHREAIRRILTGGEPLAYSILLVVVGSLLLLPTPWLLVAAAVLTALRIAAPWAGVRYARAPLGLTDVPADIALGTVPQGGVAVALGLSFVFTYGAQGPTAGDPVLTTIVLGVAGAQLVASPLMKRALAAAATRSRAPALTAPLTPPAAAPELSADTPAEWPQ